VTAPLPFLSQAAGWFAQASFSTNVVDFNAVQSAGQRSRMDLHDDLMLLGALVIVAGLVFYLTAVFRKGQRRHRDRAERTFLADDRSRPPQAAAPNGKVRRRRRRRDHRPRNPTRAETGGLPPKRAEDGAPPV
jgi:hypothetical protein